MFRFFSYSSTHVASSSCENTLSIRHTDIDSCRRILKRDSDGVKSEASLHDSIIIVFGSSVGSSDETHPFMEYASEWIQVFIVAHGS